MVGEDAAIDCVPLIHGYAPYARDGFRAPDRLRRYAGRWRALAERLRARGTGIPVSAPTVHAEAARDFAYFVAGGAIQRGLYTQSGGQPAHADAWTDDAVNRDVHDFYRATRARLEGARVRPRHSGYMTFQHSAATTINEALTNKLSAGTAVDRLNELFELSFRM